MRKPTEVVFARVLHLFIDQGQRKLRFLDRPTSAEKVVSAFPSYLGILKTAVSLHNFLLYILGLTDRQLWTLNCCLCYSAFNRQ
jgi:hypothetical protein